MRGRRTRKNLRRKSPKVEQLPQAPTSTTNESYQVPYVSSDNSIGRDSSAFSVSSDKIIVGHDTAPQSPVISAVESMPMPVEMRSPTPAMPMDVDDDIINETGPIDAFEFVGNPDAEKKKKPNKSKKTRKFRKTNISKTKGQRRRHNKTKKRAMDMRKKKLASKRRAKTNAKKQSPPPAPSMRMMPAMQPPSGIMYDLGRYQGGPNDRYGSRAARNMDYINSLLK